MCPEAHQLGYEDEPCLEETDSGRQDRPARQPTVRREPLEQNP